MGGTIGNVPGDMVLQMRPLPAKLFLGLFGDQVETVLGAVNGLLIDQLCEMGV